MSAVADASPLIFLAKVRRLHLVHELLGGDVRVAESVRLETLANESDSEESRTLKDFFARCAIEEVRHPRCFARALSRADNETLALAVRCRATILLCDDRLMRMMAETEGIRPLGTLGLILRAIHRKALSRSEARQLVDILVSAHGFRITVEVYQAVIAQIESRGGRRGNS